MKRHNLYITPNRCISDNH